MYRAFTAFMVLVSLSLFSAAFAGGWTSGGGDNIRDGHNPWFLDNVSEISYCVQVDDSSVSSSPETLVKMTERAIRDWGRIFQKYQAVNVKSPLRVGLQSWSRTSCDHHVDVRFKFGWGSLNSLEKSYLSRAGRPRDVIAQAVRTQYNRVTLRGEGFIFVASDRGPDAVSLDDSQISLPWKNPTLVYLTLFHELGHVFGIPHLTSSVVPFSERWVMSEHFPEMILNKGFLARSESSLPDPANGITRLFDSLEFEDCNSENLSRVWHSESKAIKCLNIRFVGSLSGPDQIELTFMDDQRRPLFKSKLTSLSWEDVRNLPDIVAYLPSEQLLFPAQNKRGFRILPGPGVTTGEYSGNLTFPSGVTRSILVLKKEDYVKIVGLDESSRSIRSILIAPAK